MDHLEHPSQELWNERQLWVENLNDAYCGDGSYIVSEQACALIAEAQAVFCAGAWVAVTVFVMAVVEVQLREEMSDYKGNTKQLIELSGANPKLQHLRQRRNAIVHSNPYNPAITVDDQWSARSELEDQAREAMHLMFETFYMSPWV